MDSCDSYVSMYTVEKLNELYPVIDTERLGWSLVACTFLLVVL